MRIILALFVFLLESPHSSAQLKCEDNPIPAMAYTEINEVKRNRQKPKDSGVNKSFSANIQGKFQEVAYKIYPSTTTPKKGTVIYLCGGPGVPCTNLWINNIPNEYDVVTLDYLGIGKNKAINQSESIMSIESNGEAVAALTEHLKTNPVVIYGTSFGTAVGTVAAAKITAKQKHSLKGVILEGVVGKPSNYAHGYLLQAENVWNHLNKKDQQKFINAYKKATKDMDKTEKLTFDLQLTSILNYGPQGATEALNQVANAGEQSRTKEEKINLYSKNSPMKEHLLATICQTQTKDTSLVDKKIFGVVELRTLLEPDFCKCSKAKAYDPSQHQIRGAAVIYLNGSHDPATPIASAREHFNQQSNTNKVFISPFQAGHLLMQPEPFYNRLSSCIEKLYSSAFNSDTQSLAKDASSIERHGCPDGPNDGFKQAISIR